MRCSAKRFVLFGLLAVCNAGSLRVGLHGAIEARDPAMDLRTTELAVAKWRRDSESWKRTEAQHDELSSIEAHSKTEKAEIDAAIAAVSDEIDQVRSASADLEVDLHNAQSIPSGEEELNGLAEQYKQLESEKKALARSATKALRELRRAEKSFETGASDDECDVETMKKLTAIHAEAKNALVESETRLAAVNAAQEELQKQRTSVLAAEKSSAKARQTLSELGETAVSTITEVAAFVRGLEEVKDTMENPKDLSFLELQDIDLDGICGETRRFPSVAEFVCSDDGDDVLQTDEALESADAAIQSLKKLSEAHNSIKGEMERKENDKVFLSEAVKKAAAVNAQLKDQLDALNVRKAELAAQLQTLEARLSGARREQEDKQLEVNKQITELRQKEAEAQEVLEGYKIGIAKVRSRQAEIELLILNDCKPTTDQATILRNAMASTREAIKDVSQDESHRAEDAAQSLADAITEHHESVLRALGNAEADVRDLEGDVDPESSPAPAR